MDFVFLNTAHPFYADAEALMESAFPREERRPRARQRQLADDRNSRFHALAVTENETFAGALNYWTLDGFVYVEHLATRAEFRGQGLGRRILERFARDVAAPLVLEVEPPDNDIARRRIEFYKRCGFVLWENRDYRQPPYAAGLPSVSLRIMALGNLNEARDFSRVTREILANVYA